MRPALLVLVTIASGCLMPGFGWPSEHGGGGGAARGSLFSGGGPAYCSVRPNLFTSWQDPSLKVPPNCPGEGRVRQVVRDIHEVDACVSAGTELRVVLSIDKLGRVTSSDVLTPSSADVRACVIDAVRDWEFAPAHAAGDLLVIYQRRSG